MFEIGEILNKTIFTKDGHGQMIVYRYILPISGLYHTTCR